MNLKTAACIGLALIGMSSYASAQAIPGAISLTGDQTTNLTLDADQVYQVTGLYRIMSGAILTIPAGTLIYGDNRVAQGAIQVQVGGRIQANGSATKPIIMTSAIRQGSRAGGDWAGMVLLGDAPINPAGGTATIEGGTGGTYGGTDPADNSGTLQYVRIEYAGRLFSANNELNTLTMGGVGSGTTIDYVQATYGLDDSFEWFGGNVNASHLVSFGPLDDDFDTDFGYSGIGQYMYALRDITKSDISTSNGMEADNDGTGTANTPLSNPHFANMTMIGPFYDGSPTSGIFGRAGHWRRNTNYELYNSLLTGFATGLLLDGDLTASNGVGIDDKIRGAAACPQPASFALKGVLVTAPTIRAVAGAVVATDVDNWIACAGASNTTNTTYNAAALVSISQASLATNDPRPGAGSPAVTGGVTLPASFAGRTSTTYRGAFDPAIARDAQWDAGWTNYDPHRTTYVKNKTGWNLVGLANTPTNNDKSVIYKFATGDAFSFSPATGYNTDNTLDAGVGYFLELTSNAIVEQKGTTVTLPRTYSIANAGWNIVSTGASEYANPANTTLNGGAVSLTFFGFDPALGYVVATSLEPGKAYFVELPAAGTIQFNP